VDKQLRNDYVRLVKRIAEAIDRHDPIGLRALGAPADEYETQVNAIARAASSCRNVEEWVDAIWTAFHDSFGESAGSKDNYDQLANEMFEIATGKS